jgi:hypothetical protein
MDMDMDLVGGSPIDEKNVSGGSGAGGGMGSGGLKPPGMQGNNFVTKLYW